MRYSENNLLFYILGNHNYSPSSSSIKRFTHLKIAVTSKTLHNTYFNCATNDLATCLGFELTGKEGLHSTITRNKNIRGKGEKKKKERNFLLCKFHFYTFPFLFSLSFVCWREIKEICFSECILELLKWIFKYILCQRENLFGFSSI